jgi:hypothetical protein
LTGGYQTARWYYRNTYFFKTRKVKLEYLDPTVLRRGVGEVLVVAGRTPACWEVRRGMQYRHSQKEIISYLIVLHSVGVLGMLKEIEKMYKYK